MNENNFNRALKKLSLPVLVNKKMNDFKILTTKDMRERCAIICWRCADGDEPLKDGMVWKHIVKDNILVNCKATDIHDYLEHLKNLK